MRWDLDECSRRFEQLCSRAFSPRELYKIPLIRYLVAMKHAAKYKTKPLREVLEESFGRDSLFGNDDQNEFTTSRDCSPRVAVTATDETGRRAILLANYSRQPGSKDGAVAPGYEFARPDRPDLELKIWEAAAATSAAPSYFKPFIHGSTKRTYLDGALYHNNPVRIAEQERKLIWPDVADKHPDILLSVGTSHSGVARELSSELSGSKIALR